MPAMAIDATPTLGMGLPCGGTASAALVAVLFPPPEQGGLIPSPAPSSSRGSGVTTLVTGPTVFIGANVVRALLAAGASVRVLARRGSDTRNLTDLPVE